MKRIQKLRTIISIISSIVIIGGTILIAIRHSPPRWQSATRVVSESLLNQIIRENFTKNTDTLVSSAKAVDLRVKDKDIYLIDFNSQELCGRAGCLYVAYTKEGSRVLNLVLQPMPDLFSLNSSDPTRTCLDIQQPQGNQIIIHTYCYEGNKFIKTISSATD